MLPVFVNSIAVENICTILLFALNGWIIDFIFVSLFSCWFLGDILCVVLGGGGVCFWFCVVWRDIWFRRAFNFFLLMGG
jgi:hypothetical protein